MNSLNLQKASTLVVMVALILSVSIIISPANCILEKSAEFTESTKNFQNVLDKAESYYVNEELNSSITLDELDAAYAEMKSWDPKIMIEMKLRYLYAHLMVKLLLLHKDIRFRNEEFGSVKNFLKWYRLFRPHYNLDEKKVQYAGKKLTLLAESIEQNKPLNKKMFSEAMEEYDDLVNEFVQNKTPEKKVKRLKSILDLIGRVETQIIKDFLFPIIRQTVLPVIDEAKIKKTFKQEFSKQGYIMDEGVKVWMLKAFNMKLFEDIYSPDEESSSERADAKAASA